MVANKGQGSAPTPAGAGGVATSGPVLQALTAYNAASDFLTRNPKDPKAALAQAKALIAVVEAYTTAGIIDVKTEAGKKLADTVVQLQTTLAVIEQDLGKDAAGKTLELGKALNDAQRTALEKNARDLFDLGMRGFDKTVDFLGLARGVATVLRVFGVDTTDFIQRCDDEMAAARASVPGISTATIARAPTTVAAGGAIATVSGATAGALNAMPGMARDLNTQLQGIGISLTTPTGPAAASSAPQASAAKAPPQWEISVKDAKSALLNPQNPIQGLSAQEADALLKNAAAKDGKQGHLSTNDLLALEAELVTSKPGIAKNVTTRLAAVKPIDPNAPAPRLE
jgi:hypothetical protein